MMPFFARLCDQNDAEQTFVVVVVIGTLATTTRRKNDGNNNDFLLGVHEKTTKRRRRDTKAVLAKRLCQVACNNVLNQLSVDGWKVRTIFL